VTAAAQLGVAPLVLATFGPMPLAALPANLAAGVAAGAAMMWGLPAGLIAGLVGHPWDGWLHMPTEILVSWVAVVARAAATSRLPDLGPWQVGLLAGAGAMVVLGRQVVVRCSALVAAAGVVGVAIVTRAPDGVWHLDDADVWRAGGATVVALDRPRPEALLDGLRRLRVDHIDLLVVQSASRATAATVDALEARHPVRQRVEPGSAPTARVVGGMRVVVTAEPTGRLAITVDGAGAVAQPPTERVRGPPGGPPAGGGGRPRP
jgi:hypothetical protein